LHLFSDHRRRSHIIHLIFPAEQQQAPGKPFLRILSSTEPLGLAFASEADKDEVLEFMKQLKPAQPAGAAAAVTNRKAAPKGAGIPTDAQKRQLFTADKDLEALYGQLVTSGILTESDFWRTRQTEINRLLGSSGGSGFGGGSGGMTTSNGAPRQRSGLSSVMHEVEQLHDGQTERVNIHLTPQDIQRIFLERPEVHRAYLAHVPHALPETEFWQKYFKLEYKKAARRKRLASAGRIDVNDDELDEGDELFAPFKRQLVELEAAAAKLKVKTVDPTVNLVAELGDRFSSGDFGIGQTTLINGELPAGSNNNQANSGANGRMTAKKSGGGGGSLLESLAHDLNRHSAQVLGGAIDGLADDYGSIGGDTATIAAKVAAAVQRQAAARVNEGGGGGGGARGGLGAEEVSKEVLKEWQARAASALEDLTLENKTEMVRLDIKDPRAYFGTAAGGSGGGRNKNSTAATSAATKKAKTEENGFSLRNLDAASLQNPPCSPSLALSALFEVGREENEELVRQFGPIAAVAMGKHPKDALGSVMVEFFRMEALKTNELLRHLWGCFPMTSDARKQKASRLVQVLEDQRKSLTAHLASGSGTAQQVHVTQMVRPLVDAIDAGVDRYHDDILPGSDGGGVAPMQQ
jgi:transcription initiation factor TFIIH subunit 1